MNQSSSRSIGLNAWWDASSVELKWLWILESSIYADMAWSSFIAYSSMVSWADEASFTRSLESSRMRTLFPLMRAIIVGPCLKNRKLAAKSIMRERKIIIKTMSYSISSSILMKRCAIFLTNETLLKEFLAGANPIMFSVWSNTRYWFRRMASPRMILSS